MKISEQIEALLKTRAAKVSAMQELIEKTEKESRVFVPDEATAYDQVEKEVADIDAHLTRLHGLEATIARSAHPVVRANGGSRNAPLAKGVGFARMVQLIASAQGNDQLAQRMAQQHFPDMPDLARYFEGRSLGIIARAATTPATTQDPAWAGTLVYASQLSSELIELVRAESILGQLALRDVPFNVRISRETVMIGTAQWVGEGLPKPVGKGGYDFVTMPWAKAALIVLITEELARFSNPGAETLMRDGLVRAIAEFLDKTFISATPAVANVSPGGILAGLPPGQSFASSGSAALYIAWDIMHAVTLLTTSGTARRPAWLMSPTNLVAIGAVKNALGQPEFPTVNGNGTLAGYPIVSSTNIPSTAITLIDQDTILHASDPNVAVDVSREASVQVDTAPANPPTPLVSLWQQNMIGLRAEKFEYWMRGRDTSVVQITAVDYGAQPPPPLVDAPVALAGGTKRAA